MESNGFQVKESTEEFDAIVVGTGISGGWAAKELTEKGLKTLVLERGRMVKHVDDYPTMNMDPWDFENNGELTREEKKRQQKQARPVIPLRRQLIISLSMILTIPITKINASTGCGAI